MRGNFIVDLSAVWRRFPPGSPPRAAREKDQGETGVGGFPFSFPPLSSFFHPCEIARSLLPPPGFRIASRDIFRGRIRDIIEFAMLSVMEGAERESALFREII